MRQSDEHFVPASGAADIQSAPYRPFGAEGEYRIESAVHEKREKGPMDMALKSMARVAGCEGTMIVSEDGVVLAHNAIKNIAKEGALVASLGVLSHRLSRILETGELDSIVLGREKKKVILGNRPYYFEVHLKKGVRFDEVTPSLRRTLSSLRGMQGSSGGRPE